MARTGWAFAVQGNMHRLALCLAVVTGAASASCPGISAQATPESLTVYLFEAPRPTLPDSSLFLVLATVRHRPALGYEILLTPRTHADTLDLQVDSVALRGGSASMMAPAQSSLLLPANGNLVVRIRQGSIQDSYRLTITPGWAELRPLHTALTTAPAHFYRRIPRNSVLVTCVPAGWPAGVCEAFVHAAWRQLRKISVMSFISDSAVRPYESPIHRWTDTISVTRTLVHGVDSLPLAAWKTFSERYTELFGGQSGIVIDFTTWSGSDMACYQGACR
jgi:hypothetical protein